MMYALKISSLESEQIQLINTQQMYFNHIILVQKAYMMSSNSSLKKIDDEKEEKYSQRSLPREQ